jgi:FkbM family methyltransferase
VGLKENVAAFTNWPLIYLARRGFIHTNYRLKARSGQIIEIRPESEDAGIVKSVFAKRSYIANGIAIPSGGVVVDVGANIGAFTLFAAEFASHVYAFEPEPRNYDCLRRNIALNGFDHVTPIAKAVAGSSGTREFHIAADENTGSHSLHLSEFEEETKSTFQVEVVSIADFMAEHSLERIDYLKLDCEGSEWEILENLSRETADRIGRITLEIHEISGYTHKDAQRLVESLGFYSEFGEDANYLFAWR